MTDRWLDSHFRIAGSAVRCRTFETSRDVIHAAGLGRRCFDRIDRIETTLRLLLLRRELLDRPGRIVLSSQSRVDGNTAVRLPPPRQAGTRRRRGGNDWQEHIGRF